MTIKQHTFPNGFQFIYEKPKTKLPISSIHLFCDLGSIYETPQVRGVSHFIEHMCFKGTKKIPKAKDIFVEYDKIGAYFNAYTVERFTCYTVKCNDNYIENSIDIVSDMMMNSTFNKKEFTKEYKVVIEESTGDENDPEDLITRLNNQLIYKGSSYENPVDCLDYHKASNGLHHEDVVDIYKLFYLPQRMVLSIISNIPFDTIVKFLKKTYFMVDRKTSLIVDNFPVSLTIFPQKKIQYKIVKKSGIITNLLTLSFRTCNHLSSDKYVLDLLKQVLAGGMSARLFLLLRENNGLTYSSSVETCYHEHTGEFSIFTECDSQKMLSTPGVLPLIIELLCDLIENGICQKEFDVAKGYLKGKMLLDIEDNDVPCEHNGTCALLYANTMLPIVPYSKIYETYYANITKEEVNRVIKKYFRREFMNVCLVGEHVPSLGSVEKITERLLTTRTL
jgi:predicted Zn-dependent peptidase